MTDNIRLVIDLILRSLPPPTPSAPQNYVLVRLRSTQVLVPGDDEDEGATAAFLVSVS